MKINWKVRIKNPYFWVGLLGVILSAMGVSADMFTSWDIVIAQAKALISNPFMIGSVIMAVLGKMIDPTTAGGTGSQKGLEYNVPNKDKKKQKKGIVFYYAAKKSALKSKIRKPKKRFKRGILQ